MGEKESLSKSEIIQIVSGLADQEKHFNSLETNFKLLSSTWLLGSLGTIGYLLISTDQLTINFWLLTGMVGAAGGLGILLLWMLDVRAYHKLLDAVFIQGVLLEIKYGWLPKVRTDMMMSQDGGVTKGANFYYALSSASLFAISLAGFINFSNDLVLGAAIGASGALAVIVIMIILWRSVRSERMDKLMEHLRKEYKDQVDQLI